MLIIRRLFMPGVLAPLIAIGIAVGGIIFTPHDATPTALEAAQSSQKVQRASDFLETVGFEEPTYVGFTAGRDGEFPTFRVLTLNGKTADLWIRTFPGGGWEIRLADTTTAIASANDLAYKAQIARSDWQTMSEDAKPLSADGKIEQVRLQAQYDVLSPYAPNFLYWCVPRVETQGWPR